MTARRGLQPDSLKLASQLALLRHIHDTAFRIDEALGDKSSGKTFFLRGIQGKVSRPCWNRDYFYLNGMLQNVRDYLAENCVQTVAAELFKLALDIYSRYDNRRRMGVELMVLSMLATKFITSFEMPDKYQSPFFVIEMLVSCRHRFQKPEASYFWSKQSEAILMSTFRQVNRLVKLNLPLCNDMLLKSIAVNARQLQELEIQLAMDCTEEGLFALAGKSATRTDQGCHRTWEQAMYIHKDFGSPKDWYIKDSLLFTPPPTTKRLLPPPVCDKMIPIYDTGFGCKELTKFRLGGEFIFPPIANRAKFIKREKGPIVEFGIYALLTNLPRLQRFAMGSTALAIARLRSVLDRPEFERLELPLTTLTLGWEESLKPEDLNAIARLCPRLTELKGVCVGCLDDMFTLNAGGFSSGGSMQILSSGGGVFPGAMADPDRESPEDQICSFIKKFKRLSKVTCSMSLPCFNSFLRSSGSNLTVMAISSSVTRTADLLVMRKYCVNLERLEGRFSLDIVPPSDRIPTVDTIGCSADHRAEFPEVFEHEDRLTEPGNRLTTDDLTVFEWKRLKHIDLNGRLFLRAMQLLVGKADMLETLSITNWPSDTVNNGVALSDEWIQGLIDVNPMANLRELSIRMDSDHFVEEGSFTKGGLTTLVTHVAERCPKMERIVGEFTRVPDLELTRIEQDVTEKRGGLPLRIKNAEPYREFQNSEDNDRFYGMNEGYWRQLNRNDESMNEPKLRPRRRWGYVLRPYKASD